MAALSTLWLVTHSWPQNGSIQGGIPIPMHIWRTVRSIVVVSDTKGATLALSGQGYRCWIPNKGQDKLFMSSWLCTVPLCRNYSYHSLTPPIPQQHKLAFQLPKYINCEHLHRIQILLPALQYTNHYIYHRCSPWSVTDHTAFFKACWCKLTAHL